MGINRTSLPDNLIEFFGLFASERQNVINGANHVRQSPLISSKVPVHGLMLDIETGRLEWLVNGYEQLGTPAVSSPFLQKVHKAEELIGALASIGSGDLKLPEVQIGDFTLHPQKWVAQVEHFAREARHALPDKATPAPQPAVATPQKPPPLVPVPPPVKLVKSLLKPKK